MVITILCHFYNSFIFLPQKHLPATIFQMKPSNDKSEQFEKDFGYLGPGLYTKVSHLRQTIMTAAAKTGQRPLLKSPTGSKQVIFKVMIPNSHSSTTSTPTTPTTPQTPTVPCSTPLTITMALKSPSTPVTIKSPLPKASTNPISSITMSTPSSISKSDKTEKKAS